MIFTLELSLSKFVLKLPEEMDRRRQRAFSYPKLCEI
jgi:hypothetical protein